ncbi:hypothetical protein [Haloprofundus salilacus]|uniref:hypothetical protein n=1 Tax=Haloprofundus salilacus TaxID=2876190 RepID=UPI001CCB6027|nr:hypothetical protein [Haloprofundus salilacus]
MSDTLQTVLLCYIAVLLTIEVLELGWLVPVLAASLVIAGLVAAFVYLGNGEPN